MKIIITPANSAISVTVDGTQDELTPMLKTLLNIATPISSTKTPVIQATSLPATTKDLLSPVTNDGGKSFVDSLFVLRADAQGNRAVGRKIAYHLMDLKPYTYNQIVSKFGCSPKTIDKLHALLLRNGAILTRGYNSAGQRYIQLISYPNFTSLSPKTRAKPKKSKPQPASSKATNPAIRALVGKKIPSNRTTR